MKQHESKAGKQAVVCHNPQWEFNIKRADLVGLLLPNGAKQRYVQCNTFLSIFLFAKLT